MSSFALSCSVRGFWNHGSQSEPAWLIQLAAESDAFHQAATCFVCLAVVAAIGGFFWVTSLSTQK
jgi:hypothetical protein